jgi:hypothetical protein
VYFDVPSGTFDGTDNSSIPVRVRLSSAGGLTANGPADDGEVEDYIYSFGPTAVTLQNVTASGQSTLPFALSIFGLIVVGTGFAVNRKRKNA